MTDDMSSWTDEALEIAVANVRWTTDPSQAGKAAAELTRRRRAFELERNASRRKHEDEIFNAESKREAQRKLFEQALADKQMAHATDLADKENKAALSVASATKAAACAAGFSAVGAIVAAAVAVIQLLGKHP